MTHTREVKCYIYIYLFINRTKCIMSMLFSERGDNWGQNKTTERKIHVCLRRHSWRTSADPRGTITLCYVGRRRWCFQQHTVCFQPAIFFFFFRNVQLSSCQQSTTIKSSITMTCSDFCLLLLFSVMKFNCQEVSLKMTLELLLLLLFIGTFLTNCDIGLYYEWVTAHLSTLWTVQMQK